MERILLASKWQTPDGTILESKNTHDYVDHTDKVSGEYYFLDGGNSYVRMSSNKVKMIDRSVYSTDPISVVRQHFRRGTFDADGGRKWVLMKNMSDSHLAACIKHVAANDSDLILNTVVMQYVRELAYRYDNGITVPEHDYTEADE